MARFCSACGSSLGNDDRFCADCGTKAKPQIVESAQTSGTSNDSESRPVVSLISDIPKAEAEPIVDTSPSQVEDGIEWDHEPVRQSPLAAILSGSAAFFILYLLFAIPTYILPYLGSNSIALNGLGMALGIGASPLFYLHLIFLVCLAALAFIRGSVIGRAWLVIFPVFAAIFDLTPGFNLIPLIPTGFHIATLIIGSNKPAIPAGERPNLLSAEITIAVGISLLFVYMIYRAATMDDRERNTTRRFADALSQDSKLNSASPRTEVPQQQAVQTTPPPEQLDQQLLANCKMLLSKEAADAMDKASNAPIFPVRNVVTVTKDGRTLWNGSPVDLTVLRQYWDQTMTMNPVPRAILTVEKGSDPIAERQVRAVAYRAGLCS